MHAYIYSIYLDLKTRWTHNLPLYVGHVTERVGVRQNAVDPGGERVQSAVHNADPEDPRDVSTLRPANGVAPPTRFSVIVRARAIPCSV